MKRFVQIFLRFIRSLFVARGSSDGSARVKVSRGNRPEAEGVKAIEVSPINSTATETASVVDEFKPILGIGPELYELKKGSLRLLLGYLGVTYIPQLALDIAKDSGEDPVNCLFEFLRRLRIDPDRLLVRRSEIEKDKLQSSIEVLLEADDIRRDCDVSPIPIYTALSESVIAAEQMLDKMRFVARILRRIHSVKPIFFEYQQWLDTVTNTLEHWEKYGNAEIDAILTYAESFERAQHEYEIYKKSIEDIIGKLQNSNDWRLLKGDVDEKLFELRRIQSHLLNVPPLNGKEPRYHLDDCLGMLEAIQDELKAMLNAATGTVYDRIDDVLVAAKRVLGLSDDSTEEIVKKRFRELSKKYHPDLNPHDTRANEKFIELKQSYDYLLEIFRLKGVAYV